MVVNLFILHIKMVFDPRCHLILIRIHAFKFVPHVLNLLEYLFILQLKITVDDLFHGAPEVKFLLLRLLLLLRLVILLKLS